MSEQLYSVCDGWSTGDEKTTIHPTARALVKQHQMDVWLNGAASEPRWEAWGNGGRGFAWNPNEAIIDCAIDIRQRRKAGKTHPITAATGRSLQARIEDLLS